MKVSNKDVPYLVGKRTNFRTSQGSVFSQWTITETCGQLYVVYSYGDHWPLAVYEDMTGTWYVNTDRYSNTTSRHASLVRRGIPGDAKVVSLRVEDMLAVLRHGSVGLVMASNKAMDVKEFEDVPF